MLNKKEIIKKKKYYIKKLLMNNNSEEEDIALRHSLCSMMELLRGNEGLSNVRLYNIVDKHAFNLLSITRGIKEAIIHGKTLNQSIIDLDDDYLLYLLQLTTNVKRMRTDDEDSSYDNINISDEDVVELSKEFYSNIGNEEISLYANKIFNDSSHYGFSDEFNSFYSSEFHQIHGFTVYDRIFDKAYISVLRTDDIIECKVFNHEVMHAIDYYIKKYNPKDIFELYAEVASITIDYLYFDFMLEKGFDYDEVRRYKKQCRLQSYVNAQTVFDDICLGLYGKGNSLLLSMFGINLAGPNNIDQIRSVLNNQIIKQLFLVESHVIAYGLYKQILEDKEKGLENLYKFMKEKIPNDKMPDFSFIGLDRKKLIELSKEMGNIQIFSKNKVN